MTRIPTLQPFLHDPNAAPALNTSPEALGFDDLPVIKDKHGSPSGSRVKRLSSSIERKVDKLGRSLSGKSSPASPGAATGHRRLFSISRMGKGTDRADGT